MHPQPIILASASPRRKELLAGLGYAFEVIPSHVEEVYPETLALEDVPEFLAELKADSLAKKYPSRIVLAADTVVILENEILGKPVDTREAFEMITKLSGKKHIVITGVCIISEGTKYVFSDTTEVYFHPLKAKEITHYVEKFQPLDKAGAYGVQEWIGYVAVEKIIGSFYNVMGLPVDKIHQYLAVLRQDDCQ